jgi:hypothetical protein
MPVNNTQPVSGNFLLKKMVEAMPAAISHRRAFDEFDHHLREDRLEEVKEWEVEYNAWVEKPMGSPCIFDTSEPCKFFVPIHPQLRGLTYLAVTVAQVKLQLANEEAARSGFSTNAPHTPSTFIMLGLDLEQFQYVTCFTVSGIY